jgi:pimeloyl-ACP methyl ester carboxylesterase
MPAGEGVDGERSVVHSTDGTPIGLMSAGTGPPLLLVHGGLTGMARWAPLWPLLTPRFAVTAMDRRGRGSSGDAQDYALEREFDDVRAVAEALALGSGEPVDVFGHSLGAVCALGAARQGAPMRRLVLYEPPGPATVPADWLQRLHAMVAGGQTGRAVASFLVEVIGLTSERVDELRAEALQAGSGPGQDDVLAVASRTLGREAEALTALHLDALAAGVGQSVRFLLGTASPPWAAAVTTVLAAHLPGSEIVALEGEGHEGLDSSPDRVVDELVRFLALE